MGLPTRHLTLPACSSRHLKWLSFIATRKSAPQMAFQKEKLTIDTILSYRNSVPAVPRNARPLCSRYLRRVVLIVTSASRSLGSGLIQQRSSHG